MSVTGEASAWELCKSALGKRLATLQGGHGKRQKVQPLYSAKAKEALAERDGRPGEWQNAEQASRERKRWDVIPPEEQGQAEGEMVVIEVPKKYIAKIIGVGGTRIARIAKETGAVLNARDQSTDPCRLRITGRTMAIEAARQEVVALITEANSRFAGGTLLEIPMANIGKVIGIRGAQINQIQTTTGCKVDVDKSRDPCIVKIAGEADNIAKAEQMIRALTMESADEESEYFDLPRHVSGAILGVGGSRLRELQDKSGARIDLDKTQLSVCRMRVSGTPDQIEFAKNLVLEAMDSKPPEKGSKGSKGKGKGTATGAAPPSRPPEVLKVDLLGSAESVMEQMEALQTQWSVSIWVDGAANVAEIQGQGLAAHSAKDAILAIVNAERLAQSEASSGAKARRTAGWIYDPPDGCTMAIRKAPRVDAEEAGYYLEAGDEFQVLQELPGRHAKTSVTFLKLADGRGWVFDVKPGVGQMCVRSSDKEAKDRESSRAPSGLPPKPSQRPRGLPAPKARQTYGAPASTRPTPKPSSGAYYRRE